MSLLILHSFNLHLNLTTETSILGTPSTIQDPLWYHDIGATHHTTHDPFVFSNKNAYTGNYFVQLVMVQV